MYTILAIGFAKWRGSDPRALAQAFRNQGNKLIEIDAEDYVSWRWSGLYTRIIRRLLLRQLVEDYNRDILKQAETSEFDFILVFKGMYIKKSTLIKLKKYRKSIYNFYPDVSFEDHGEYIPKSLEIYDCVFTTKSFHGLEEIKKYKIKELSYVRHGYDPEVHKPIELNEEQKKRYECDISFIGCWSVEKENTLLFILKNRPNYKIIVYGIGWKYATKEFKKIIGKNLRDGVFGDELAIAYTASKINLGLLSFSSSDKTKSDLTTVRSFQIPASKSLLMHEDNKEIRNYYQEDEEIILFTSQNDLLVKLDRLLENEVLRKEICEKGYKKTINNKYDYTSAALEIINKQKIKNNM